MDAAVNAARWIVGKALAPVIDGLLESWAASVGLGPNIDALKMQLLYTQGMLDSAQGRDIRNPALKELLHKLRQIAYGADDVLDELDYFRIKDVLKGTYHTANVEDRGYVDGLVLNARYTVKAAVNRLKPSSRSRDDASRGDPGNQDDGVEQGCLSIVRSCGGHGINSSPSSPTNQGVQGRGRRFLCGTWLSKSPHTNWAIQTQTQIKTQTKPPKFNRVEISTKMVGIIHQLKPLCAMVSTILSLELLGSSRILLKDIPINPHKTTPNIIEPNLYGRKELKNNIVDGITHGIYCTNEITVIPLVGPGGIGKTTLTQHIYRELKGSFVSVWICVSLDFNADRLVKEIVNQIPKVDNEKDNANNQELIEHRLKSKRLLLVLDDMWTYHEDEWKKLLAPLRGKGGEKGHVVIVTTRIPKVASMVTTNNSSIDVERLGDKDIMEFFQVCVFGDQKPWEGDYGVLENVGIEIVNNLKGFPLAAKTVGRLLRNQLTLDHWTRVAESREWKLQTNDNDIMPALKLSYDYLPFHLQQCFSTCALFPEDYEFGSKELVHFWIGLDIVHSHDQGKTTEDVALSYLNELVNHGFFKKNDNHYVIHDLLHDLALKVSSYECLSICSSNVRSIHVPTSIRHMSIIVDNTDVMDLISFEHYKRYLEALGKRLKVQNLRTLMLFGEYHGNFVKTFRVLFRKGRALRAIFLSGASYSVDDVLPNFSNLVHLRYLRIKSVDNEDMCLPRALFSSYHLEFIDLEEWGGSFGSTSQMGKLIKLRHFFVPKDKVHSSIFGVGKLKFLQELRRFEVGKEPEGFELSQLGELSELEGSLGIYNLQKVQNEGEANALNLIHKNHLHKLTLEWDNSGINSDAKHEENVLESMVPHKNLQDLCIQGHRGDNCPSWLGGCLSVENLESLSLRDVSWNKLPPLGDMWFIDNLGVESQGPVSTLSFQCLKRLELVGIPGIRKWVGKGTCDLFSHLEVLIIEDCPKLVELPFSHPACYQAKKEENLNWFPKLRDLKITGCPKLSALPPIPWTSAPCSAEIERVGCGFDKLSYSLNYKEELSLEIKGKEGNNDMFWNGLDFHNLADLVELNMEKCPPLPLIHLQKLKSLKTLGITRMSTVFSLCEGESHSNGFPLPVERILIEDCDANGEELTRLLSYFPKLTLLLISECKKITGLGVVEQQPTVVVTITAPSPSSSANKSEHAQDGHDQQQTIGEDEIASATQGLLLLPPQLQDLIIWSCAELRLLSNSLGNESARGGLQSLSFLLLLGCPKFLTSYSPSSSSCFPFPASLQKLDLDGVEGMETLACLSNLVSLTRLDICGCQDLRGEGLWPLVAHDHLIDLDISKTPKFFTDSELSLPHDEERRSYSFKLKSLRTDHLAGVLTLPICSFLSSSLTRLIFDEDNKVERFTEGQEEALQLLNSLQELEFWYCEKLQRLPAGLTKLTNLKRILIGCCPAIQLLPKDRLPNSLQELQIDNCPAIKSLPKECLTSSLRRLEVIGGISEELKRQCRKLKGTIPIIIDYQNY